MISDYCKGDQKNSPAFQEYVKQRGYNLLTVKDYGATIEKAGFKVRTTTTTSPGETLRKK